MEVTRFLRYWAEFTAWGVLLYMVALCIVGIVYMVKQGGME